LLDPKSTPDVAKSLQVQQQLLAPLLIEAIPVEESLPPALPLPMRTGLLQQQGFHRLLLKHQVFLRIQQRRTLQLRAER